MATRGTNAIVRGDYAPTWRQFHTGNNCMSADLFRTVGGFDESYKRAEDDEFGARLELHGCRFHFLPSALAYHYPHRTMESWLAIPRQYAYYTVVLDRAYPQLGYLADRKRELAGSNPLLRIARTVAGGPARTAAAVKLATTIARLTHRFRLDALTLSALSLAFDLNFVEALRAAEAQPSEPSRT